MPAFGRDRRSSSGTSPQTDKGELKWTYTALKNTFKAINKHGKSM